MVKPKEHNAGLKFVFNQLLSADIRKTKTVKEWTPKVPHIYNYMDMDNIQNG